MKKTVLYKYTGTNGVILSPVHLEDAYYVRVIRLTSDAGKILSNGHDQRHIVTVAEDEVNDWYEEDIVVNSK